jgi:predicted DNA-binding protein with PD1-like motif
MQARQIHEADGQRTFAVVLDAGDEVMACLEAFAVEHGIAAAQITAIGAFSKATLAFWDGARKEYLEIPVEEATEVVAMLGDVSVMEDGKPKLHLHTVLGRRDASTLGGHLLKGWVEPTLEVVLTESPAHLRRIHDPAKGLPLIRL